MRTYRHSILIFITALGASAVTQQLLLPNKPDSVRFAVIGDNGTGDSRQYDTAARLIEWRSLFPYTFVLMMGDNMYGGEKPKDFANKFEKPYMPLTQAGVKFYASLGNHDDPENQRAYKGYNMGGERFYTFKPKNGVRFFALDSNYMDKAQLEWLDKELSASGSDWKICYFHHPLYSSGATHGSAVDLRRLVEPLFIKHKVNIVFSGHEHFYERIKPQNGIYYFISGCAGKLRKGDIRKTDLTAKGYDDDNSFMLVEIAGDQLHFQTITRAGQTIDSGVINRQNSK
jgi:hypothetical protein